MNAVQKLLRRAPRKPKPGPRPPSAPANGAAPVAPFNGAILSLMTAKERLLQQAPDWTEEQAERALVAAEARPDDTIDGWGNLSKLHEVAFGESNAPAR